MRRHIDRVRLATARGHAEISWSAATDLRERLGRVPEAASLLARFEAVGVSRPVIPTVEEEAVLLAVVEHHPLFVAQGVDPLGREDGWV